MKRGFMAVRVVAVAFYKISSNLLNAKMQAGSRIRAKRCLMTAQMVLWAVVFSESTPCLLLVKISYKNVLRSLLLKLEKVTAIRLHISFRRTVA